MGFFKKLFGLDKDEPPESAPPSKDAGKGHVGGPRSRADRPPLADPPPGQSQSIDDALELRDAGDKTGARALLAEIDRGGGLRTVLRAAAELEAGEDESVRPLLRAIAGEAAGYKLLLQLAAALEDPAAAAPYVELAKRAGAPAWALAWTRAAQSDDIARREGLVELLFADAPLARTVAARDLHLEGAVAEAESAPRYAAFAHGRDSIRRFGAALVARAIDRALEEAP